jgi:hypothetical protein
MDKIICVSRLRGLLQSSRTTNQLVLDDAGTTQVLIIPNSFLVPGGTSGLLSPQHWAQEIQDHYPRKHETRCVTKGDSVILEWDQRKYSNTITLDPEGTNVGTIWSIPGCDIDNKAISYIHDNHPNICFDTKIIEIINPDPYTPNMDEDGIIVEPSDSMTTYMHPVSEGDIDFNVVQELEDHIKHMPTIEEQITI